MGCFRQGAGLAGALLPARGDFLTAFGPAGLGTVFHRGCYIVRVRFVEEGLRQTIYRTSGPLGVGLSTSARHELLHRRYIPTGTACSVCARRGQEVRDKQSGLITADALSSIGGVAGTGAACRSTPAHTLPTERLATETVTFTTTLTPDDYAPQNAERHSHRSDPAGHRTGGDWFGDGFARAGREWGQSGLRTGARSLLKGWAERVTGSDSEGNADWSSKGWSKRRRNGERLGQLRGTAVVDERRLSRSRLLSVRSRTLLMEVSALLAGKSHAEQQNVAARHLRAEGSSAVACSCRFRSSCWLSWRGAWQRGTATGFVAEQADPESRLGMRAITPAAASTAM